MITSGSVKEVWCDLHDDAVLVHDDQAGEIFEFVQVKNENHNQLWTLSLLCEKKKGKKSIFEKLLAHDCCVEPVRFRLVTSLPFVTELSVLATPVGSPQRRSRSLELNRIATEITKKTKNVLSPKNNDAKFWLENFIWESASGETAVKDRNLNALQSFLEQNAIFLTSQQRNDLYALLERDVETAAQHKFNDGIDKNIIVRDAWKESLLIKARRLECGVSDVQPNDLLVAKMKAANINDSFIKSAVELRIAYSSSLRRSPYLDAEGREKRFAANQVLAAMQSLRAALEAGDLRQDGVKFHQTCVQRLETLKNELKDKIDIDLAFLQGCMYDITGRCQHHFVRSDSK